MEPLAPLLITWNAGNYRLFSTSGEAALLLYEACSGSLAAFLPLIQHSHLSLTHDSLPHDSPDEGPCCDSETCMFIGNDTNTVCSEDNVCAEEQTCKYPYNMYSTLVLFRRQCVWQGPNDQLLFDRHTISHLHYIHCLVISHFLDPEVLGLSLHVRTLSLKSLRAVEESPSSCAMMVPTCVIMG